MSLYQDLVKLGVPHSNRASDLYFPVTEQTTGLVKKWKKKTTLVVNKFTHEVEKTLWYEIPFAYDPFWEARHKKKAK